ncbi:MAG: VWA domain-containing protein, partial [Candidatus Aureabacteria bacterium]|nr:VWA domain-containing protein [Candidatus Auribacterota bacterium]
LGNRRYNRLEVVKRVIADFIAEREQDRIGVVMFSGEPMTLCPLTTDYSVLTEFLEGVHVGILPDGTAIGDAVAFGVNRLKKSKSRSRIMILLTDGDNNAGQIDPVLSGDLARTQNVKVYTIGAGSDGPVPYPVNDPIFGKSYQNVIFPLNESLLKDIAKKTNGFYFRATDTESLKNIYEEINRMEKTKSKTSVSTEYREIFGWFLWPAMLLLCLEIFLAHTLFLRVP